MTDDEMLEAYNTAVDAAMDRACERDGFASNTSRESRVAGLRAIERAAAARALEDAAQTYPFTLLGVGTTWHEAQKVLCERAAEIRGAKRDAARQEAGA